MYTLLLYVHVLALVYWLGGDLGTFLSSRHVLRSDLGVESRQTAFKILMECDMGPRLLFSGRAAILRRYAGRPCCQAKSRSEGGYW
jgi:hypothetical protein